MLIGAPGWHTHLEERSDAAARTAGTAIAAVARQPAHRLIGIAAFLAPEMI